MGCGRKKQVWKGNGKWPNLTEGYHMPCKLRLEL